MTGVRAGPVQHWSTIARGIVREVYHPRLPSPQGDDAEGRRTFASQPITAVSGCRPPAMATGHELHAVDLPVAVLGAGQSRQFTLRRRRAHIWESRDYKMHIID